MNFFKKSLLLVAVMVGLLGASTFVYAQTIPSGVDLTITVAVPNGGNEVYQYSAPTLNVSLINTGNATLSAKNIPA
jgi:hypothetical protein